MTVRLLTALLLAVPSAWAQPTAAPAPAPAPTPTAAPAKPAQPPKPAWLEHPDRMRNWVNLKGPDNKSFWVHAGDFDKFRSDAAQGKATPITLYEGEFKAPASSWRNAWGWRPSWEAVKNYGVWMNEATFKVSEYRLEAGGGQVVEAVKGNERVAVFPADRGGRLTLGKVTIQQPQASTGTPAPGTPAPSTPAPGTPTPPAPASTPQPAGPPAPAQAPAPTSGDWTFDRAAQTLFPGEDGSAQLVSAIVRLDDIDRPGASAAFIREVQQAQGNLSALQQSWRGKMAEACAGGGESLGNGAMEQAEALAQRVAGEGGEPEDAVASTSFEPTVGPLYGPCSRWRSAPVRTPRRRTPQLTAEIQPPRPTAVPPAPRTEQASETAATPDESGGAAKKKGLSKGIFKFLAVILGAALGAATGGMMGPVFGLIGMAAGAGIGLYVASKYEDPNKK
ncbi:MAG: hypothetical protein HY553_23100 [Elusimicrobia bacterium]|nr:hypothetical protein [Elusimicrobiota bacterium]